MSHERKGSLDDTVTGFTEFGSQAPSRWRGQDTTHSSIVSNPVEDLRRAAAAAKSKADDSILGILDQIQQIKTKAFNLDEKREEEDRKRRERESSGILEEDKDEEESGEKPMKLTGAITRLKATSMVGRLLKKTRQLKKVESNMRSTEDRNLHKSATSHYLVNRYIQVLSEHKPRDLSDVIAESKKRQLKAPRAGTTSRRASMDINENENQSDDEQPPVAEEQDSQSPTKQGSMRMENLNLHRGSTAMSVKRMDSILSAPATEEPPLSPKSPTLPVRSPQNSIKGLFADPVGSRRRVLSTKSVKSNKSSEPSSPTIRSASFLKNKFSAVARTVAMFSGSYSKVKGLLDGTEGEDFNLDDDDTSEEELELHDPAETVAYKKAAQEARKERAETRRRMRTLGIARKKRQTLENMPMRPDVEKRAALPYSHTIVIDGRMVASISQDCYTIRVWDIHTHELIRDIKAMGKLSGFLRPFTKIICLPKHDNMLVGVGEDGVLRFFDVHDGRLLCHVLTSHPTSDVITSLSTDEDNKTLFTGCLDGHVKIWNIEFMVTKCMVRCGGLVKKNFILGLKCWKAHNSRIACVQHIPGTRNILTVPEEGVVRGWTFLGKLMYEEHPRMWQRPTVYQWSFTAPPGGMFKGRWTSYAHRAVYAKELIERVPVQHTDDKPITEQLRELFDMNEEDNDVYRKKQTVIDDENDLCACAPARNQAVVDLLDFLINHEEHPLDYDENDPNKREVAVEIGKDFAEDIVYDCIFRAVARQQYSDVVRESENIIDEWLDEEVLLETCNAITDAFEEKEEEKEDEENAIYDKVHSFARTNIRSPEYRSSLTQPQGPTSPISRSRSPAKLRPSLPELRVTPRGKPEIPPPLKLTSSADALGALNRKATRKPMEEIEDPSSPVQVMRIDVGDVKWVGLQSTPLRTSPSDKFPSRDEIKENSTVVWGNEPKGDLAAITYTKIPPSEAIRSPSRIPNGLRIPFTHTPYRPKSAHPKVDSSQPSSFKHYKKAVKSGFKKMPKLDRVKKRPATAKESRSMELAPEPFSLPPDDSDDVQMQEIQLSTGQTWSMPISK